MLEALHPNIEHRVERDAICPPTAVAVPRAAAPHNSLTYKRGMLPRRKPQHWGGPGVERRDVASAKSLTDLGTAGRTTQLGDDSRWLLSCAAWQDGLRGVARHASNPQVLHALAVAPLPTLLL